MTIRRIMCICMALVLALACAGCSGTSGKELQAQLDAALAKIDELEQREDLQPQLDAANARIAELEQQASEQEAEPQAEADAQEEAAPQGDLEAANARIAELEAQVETYYPFYIAQIVARFGDHIIWLEDVQGEYDAVAAQYESYGLSLAAYGMEDMVKRDIVDSLVKNAVLFAKAEELGLDQFDEEAEANLEAEAQELLEQYIDYYIQTIYPDAEEVTDDMRAEASGYWTANGMGADGLLQSIRESAILDAVSEYITKDVTVTEEDIQAAYEALVEQDQTNYANDRTYNSDRTSGVAIAWNPEGYRAVKHVLILFSDEQAQRYSELQGQINSLNAERAAIESASEEESGAEAETRTLEEVDADIAACGLEIEQLYSLLMPTAEEVIAAFEDGTDFDELIAQYNDDPGMQNEPSASQGYAVSADSTYWEQAFTDGAMSIANVGEISAPVYGSNGIHIIYYLADIEPGEVGLDAIRDSVTQDAEEQKLQTTYNDQVAAWIEEAGVEYHYESFGITAE